MDKEVRTYSLSADKVNIDASLALRYLRVRREPDGEIKNMLTECFKEFLGAVSYKASYRYFDIKIDGKKIYFDDEMVLESERLASNLSGCSGAFVFVATTSAAVDRLIHKYSNLRVSRAVVLDAIGSAAIEGFCDLLCHKLESDYGATLKPRFSPGYGDLSILSQSKILKACDSSRKIGVTLTDSRLMIPKKSVSAIIGVCNDEKASSNISRCDNCDKTNCLYME